MQSSLSRTFLFALLLAAAPLRVTAQTQASTLASDPHWQALLHVNRGATIHGRHQSYVDDQTFFLHPEGKRDMEAELRASIAALQPDGAPARCRFPARFRFLAERLDWVVGDAPFAHCEDYLDWRRQVPTGSVVLVFPAAYLNSPSSMFGHTLLRFDHEPDPVSAWQSWAVNFGARTAGQDNSLLYVYRGLFGGYPGYFVVVPYVTKIQEYSHLENRDIWEYRLDLGDAEIERLVDHLWELREIRFDYYFFDENCAFRLLELVEVARPGAGLLEDFRIAEVPVNTVRTLHERGIVAATHYRPSKAVALHRDIQALDAREQRLAEQLMHDPARASSPEFVAYPAERRHLMARVAYRTLRYRHRSEDRDQDVARRSFELLGLMNTLPAPPERATDGDAPIPPGDESEPALTEREFDAAAAPERGHGTQMLAAAAGQRDAGDEARDFGEIRYRFTYHDLLDNAPGFLRGAQIAGLDLRLRSTDSEGLELESLDVVHIRSIAPRDRFIKPVSWFVQGGLERVVADERRRLARFVQGGPGLAWDRGRARPYLFALARVENNGAWAPWLQAGAGARVGSLWQFGAVQLDTGVEGIWFGNDEYRHRWNLDMNIAVSGNHALRLGWEREGWRGDGDNEFGIEWRHYFD